ERIIVVPAKAGTHTPWPRVIAAKGDGLHNNRHRWLWVPAFAGTTYYATPARSTSWTWTMPTGFLPSATISTVTAGFDDSTLSRMNSAASMPGAMVRGFFVMTSSTSAVIRSGRM